MVISGSLSSALRKKPLWPGFTLWYKFMNELPYDTKLVVENVIFSHHHYPHMTGFNPLMSTSFAFLGDETDLVVCDLLDRDESTGAVTVPTVFWSENTMNAFAKDHRAARYHAWGNAVQFGNGLPKQLAVFEFVNLPQISETMDSITIFFDGLVADHAESMFVAEADMTETDRQNILRIFNAARTMINQSERNGSPINNSTLLYDVTFDDFFDDAGKSSLTLDDALRDHPITGEPIRLRDDILYMKQFIESYTFSGITLPKSLSSVVSVAGTMAEPFVIETNEKRFKLFNADAESGSDLITEWDDIMLEPLVVDDDSIPDHLLNIQPRTVASPERSVRVLHVADTFYPLYPNMESMRIGPRNVFGWVDLMHAIAIGMDDDTVMIQGHATGWTKLNKATGRLADTSDRVILYEHAQGLKSIELCALQHINSGREKNEAIERCQRNAALPPTLFEGYGTISAHVDAVYKSVVGSWNFDTVKALVRETSTEAISLLVGSLGSDTVMSMARDIKLRADCGDASLYSLSLELFDMASRIDTQSPTPETLLLKAELLAALYRMETNPTTASMLLLDVQEVSESLAAFEGYEEYLLSDRTYSTDEDHPLNVKPFMSNLMNK